MSGGKKDRWVPMQRGRDVILLTEENVVRLVETGRYSRETAVAALKEDQETTEYFVNDLYQVALHRVESGYGKTVQLNIRRRDGKPIFRDWRHFQRIKNELVGEDIEGVELYPAEERHVDTSNKYSIWCVVEPGFRFPFGWLHRDVLDESPPGTPPGRRQRRL
jgi:hypothetical protein